MTVGVGGACSSASTSACSSLSLSFSFSMATATPVAYACRLLAGQILLELLLHQSSLPGAEREAGSGGAAHLGARGMSAGAGAGGRRRLQRAAERRAARRDCVSERRAERREWRSRRAGTIADWELGIWGWEHTLPLGPVARLGLLGRFSLWLGGWLQLSSLVGRRDRRHSRRSAGCLAGREEDMGASSGATPEVGGAAAPTLPHGQLRL